MNTITEIPPPPHIHPRHVKEPISFDEFFDLGLEDGFSPFLTPQARKWGYQLHLKASVLAAILLVLSFATSFMPTLVPLSYLLLTGVYFFAGIPALIASLEDLMQAEVNIDVLMTLAAFSSVLIGSGMEGGLLLVLFSLSSTMEEMVSSKAKGAINTLKKLSPTKACIIDEEGRLIERAIRDVEVGQLMLVKSGEMVPLDSIVVAGRSSLNLVHLTGESIPVVKAEGDEVPAGGMNLEGALTLKVSRTSSDSTLSRIITLVTEAQSSRPKLQRWLDRFSERYALSIILLSTLFALSLPFLLSIPFLGREGSLYRALAFLIAASPCALILAIPIAYLSAISACARKGIVLKGGVILDALASCKAIAFDKTGTLTTGELTCIAEETLTNPLNIEANMALAVAAALEQNAVHPVAKAILALAKERHVETIPLAHFNTVPGFGLQAVALLKETPQEVAIGRVEWILERFSDKKAFEDKMQLAKRVDELCSLLAIGSSCFLFRFRDTLRPSIPAAIARLRKEGRWKLVMLTGDHEETARTIAHKLGLDAYYASLHPEDKLEHISNMAKEYHVAMVGDGMNDAPALARATVGISMGKVGSATAMEAADVVLLHDNLEQLDWLMEKARMTQKIVRQNLTIALGAIFIASTLAVMGTIPLWLAVVLHEGGTVCVGLNALRLLKIASPGDK